MTEPKRETYWVNSLKPASPLAGHDPFDGLPGCFLASAGDRDALMRSDATLAGSLYPQNPSSVLAARVLAPEPEEEVLDLAAAPGGKTLQMAALMANTGRIAAVEPVKARFHRMRANLARCGVANVQFYQADGRGVGRKVPGRFDRVLLDAPCSSESRIRLGDPSSYAHWKPRKVRECARKQRALILSAFTALRPGGRLLYCTCSFAPEENELVVAHLLREAPEADVVPIELPAAPAVAALGSWEGTALDERIGLARRIVPDEVWDGFFLCLLRRRC
jgi:16S rRNA (cytosine1407-C5)-methyltransferase